MRHCKRRNPSVFGITSINAGENVVSSYVLLPVKHGLIFQNVLFIFGCVVSHSFVFWSSFHAGIGSGVQGLRGSGLCLSFVVAVVGTVIRFFFVVKSIFVRENARKFFSRK